MPKQALFRFFNLNRENQSGTLEKERGLAAVAGCVVQIGHLGELMCFRRRVRLQGRELRRLGGLRAAHGVRFSALTPGCERLACAAWKYFIVS
jgi:hypothetical protein